MRQATRTIEALPKRANVVSEPMQSSEARKIAWPTPNGNNFAQLVGR